MNHIGWMLVYHIVYMDGLPIPKKYGFTMGLQRTAAGLILIIYSSSTMEIGDIMGGNARVCHSSSAYSRGIHSLVGSQ